MVVHLGEIELVEHQASRFQALVVAGDAVLIEKGALGGGRRCKHRGNRRNLLRTTDRKRALYSDDRQRSREAQPAILMRMSQGKWPSARTQPATLASSNVIN